MKYACAYSNYFKHVILLYHERELRTRMSGLIPALLVHRGGAQEVDWKSRMCESRELEELAAEIALGWHTT